MGNKNRVCSSSFTTTYLLHHVSKHITFREDMNSVKTHEDINETFLDIENLEIRLHRNLEFVENHPKLEDFKKFEKFAILK